MEIQIIREPISVEVVRQAAIATFGDFVKIVVDIRRGIIGLGGAMHADAEAALLEV